jgi:Tol biopolymer transport system component
MTRRQRGGLNWPLWAVEGMAQYLSVGAVDPDASLWLRDAVASGRLPERRRDAERRFSPYKYGHAFWAYLAGRFGPGVAGDVLKAPGGIEKRLETVTKLDADRLYEEWRAAARGHVESLDRGPADSPARLLRERETGRYHLGPALSPDGHRAVFFSERDRLSLDLFVACTSSGVIQRKLLTTTGSPSFESLQAIRSAGAWSPQGDRLVFAAIERGQPALVVLDMTSGRTTQTIRLPAFGQILTPAWAPDGRSVAFSALDGGSTDLYQYFLATNELRRLTDDLHADLQPSWSPDGGTIAFVTDRFTSELDTLRFGATELASLDVATGEIRRIPAFDSARHFNPQWSGDPDTLYFVADPTGVSNVYRLDLAAGSISQITDVDGGVTGLAPHSPSLSVARDAPLLAFTVFRDGRYELETRRGAEVLEGRPLAAAFDDGIAVLPPKARADVSAFGGIEPVPALAGHDRSPRTRAYSPRLFVEAIGQPTLSSGGGPFGTYWRGGGSLLFSDLLGERKVMTYVQISNRLRETAFGIRYLNRERRWNWGVSADLQPSLRRLPRRRVSEEDGQPAVTRETIYFDRSQFRLAGTVAYPLNRSQRIEFDAGVRHTRYRQSVVSTVRSLDTGRLIERDTVHG